MELAFSLEDSSLQSFATPSVVEHVEVVGDMNDDFATIFTKEALLFVKSVVDSLALSTSLFPLLEKRENKNEVDLSKDYTKSWKAECQGGLKGPVLFCEPSAGLTSSIVTLIPDFSSSSSYCLDTYVSAMKAVCFDSKPDHILLEPLQLPNYHFFVHGVPVPAHIITLCLYVIHVAPCKKESSVFVHLSGIETTEESQYFTTLLKLVSAHTEHKANICPVVVVESLSCAVLLDHICSELPNISGIILNENLCFLSSQQTVGNCQEHFLSKLRQYVIGIAQHAGISALLRNETASTSNEMIEAVNRAREQGWHSCGFISATGLFSDIPSEWVPIIECKSSIKTLSDAVKKVESEKIVQFKDLETEFLLTLQYLALFINGSARFPQSSGPVMDAAAFEIYRLKIQRYMEENMNIKLKSGETKKLDTKIATEILSEVFHRICHGVGSVQVERTLETKLAYDDSFTLMKRFVATRPLSHFSLDAYCYLISPFINNPARLQCFLKYKSHTFLRYENVCIGGEIIFTTNESFAPAISLCKPDFPSFRPKSFGPQGQVFDGWETRRHNMFPPDYTVIKLKTPCRIYGVNIDTAHFSGNSGQGGSVLGLAISLRHNRYQEEWVNLVDDKVLEENNRNYFPTTQQPLVQYVRLNQYPDGGIARLELFGERVEGNIKDQLEESKDKLWHEKVAHYFSLVPTATGFADDFQAPYSDVSLLGPPDSSLPASEDPPMLLFPDLFDYGGSNAAVIAGSNTQYSIPSNILRPGRGINMGDGWETSRMRLPVKEDIFALDTCVYQYCNWSVIKLNQEGSITKFVVDTFHFKNNTPQAIAIEGAHHPSLSYDNYYDPSVVWDVLLPPSGLVPHQEQSFDADAVNQAKKYTHVLVKIYPCGGISRLRLYGPSPCQ